MFVSRPNNHKTVSYSTWYSITSNNNTLILLQQKYWKMTSAWVTAHHNYTLIDNLLVNACWACYLETDYLQIEQQTQTRKLYLYTLAFVYQLTMQKLVHILSANKRRSTRTIQQKLMKSYACIVYFQPNIANFSQTHMLWRDCVLPCGNITGLRAFLCVDQRYASNVHAVFSMSTL